MHFRSFSKFHKQSTRALLRSKKEPVETKNSAFEMLIRTQSETTATEKMTHFISLWIQKYRIAFVRNNCRCH